jgi:hypothetical protein
MRMQKLVGLAVFPIAVALAGCHEHPHEEGPQADEYVVDCETADGGFAASDEDFAAMVNAEAAGMVMTTPADSLPVLTAPTTDRVLSATTPPTFTFTATTTAAAPAAAKGTTMACRAPGATKRNRLTKLGRVFSAIESELVLERTAEAHCPATSGDKYLLRLENGAGVALFTAMLSVTTYTPDAAKWSQKLAGKSAVKVTLMRATFSGEAIAAGPFKATPAPNFVVGP